MAGDSNSPLHPSVQWAQRNDKIYLTINVEDCKNASVQFEETKLIFKGKGGPENKEFAAEIEFYKEIVPEESKYVILARNIPMSIKKKEQGPFWPRILKETKKFHWLKTDFGKWRDEDDSDVDEQQDVGFEDMMKQMGNFNTNDPNAAGLQTEEPEEDEEDSDDDELPDLE